jgi:hypothetical protein
MLMAMSGCNLKGDRWIGQVRSGPGMSVIAAARGGSSIDDQIDCDVSEPQVNKVRAIKKPLSTCFYG